MTVVAVDTVPPRAAAATLGERHWRVAAIALLSVRFIQGFIYWGGGSRRFIHSPEKLDPDAPTWMANKFRSAMHPRSRIWQSPQRVGSRNSN
jgi:thiosulfate dehydrogenase [quinone] large subunit